MSDNSQDIELWSPDRSLVGPLVKTPEELMVVKELTKILLSEGGDDYEAHYASLRDVSPDAINHALSTFFKPTLRTILGYLRSAGDTLAYPVTVSRGSASRKYWAEYVLRRVNLTRLSLDPHASFERLREEFGAASRLHDLSKEIKSKESSDAEESSDGKSVHYNVFATNGDIKLYSGYVRVLMRSFSDHYFDRTDRKNLIQDFGFQDSDTIAGVSNYNPHPFDKNLGFYFGVGIDTSDIDRQILEQIAADLFSGPVSGLTIYRIDPDYTAAYYSGYQDGDRESNPPFERVLARTGFQRYEESGYFIKVNPYRPS